MVAKAQSVEMETALPAWGPPRSRHGAPRRVRRPEPRHPYHPQPARPTLDDSRRVFALWQALHRVRRLSRSSRRSGRASIRNLMVGVQVTLAAAEPRLQLGQHLLGWWRAQPELPEFLHDVWLPTAVDASPLVTDEAEDSKPAMVGVLAALCGGPPPFIVLPLRLPFVFRAIRFPIAESPATRRVAWTFG